MKLRIDYLANHTQVIPELSELHVEAFGPFNPEMTVESRMEQLHARLGKNSIPLSLVAFDEDKLIGSACLIHQDMSTHPELRPWVASGFVRKEYRRRGVGTALMRAIEGKARRLGVKKLYLFTPDMQAFYSTLDWLTIATEMYRGRKVTIMEKEIAA